MESAENVDQSHHSRKSKDSDFMEEHEGTLTGKEMRVISTKMRKFVDENKNINILIAEDENTQRYCLIDMIETFFDYKVYGAKNGEEATKLLKEGKITFNLVLLDLYMPIKDGFEVLSFILDSAQHCHVPVIMMSADKEVKNIAACLKKGARNYLTKPIKP